jgi:hypothetical protein
MFFGFVAQRIENDSGLHAGDAALRINLEDVGQVLREVEDDRYVAALPGERSACAATKKRGAEFAAKRERSHNVIGIAGEDDSNWNLTVVRAIGRVESTALIVEANVTAHMLSQGFGEPHGIG